MAQSSSCAIAEPCDRCTTLLTALTQATSMIQILMTELNRMNQTQDQHTTPQNSKRNPPIATENINDSEAEHIHIHRENQNELREVQRRVHEDEERVHRLGIAQMENACEIEALERKIERIERCFAEE